MPHRFAPGVARVREGDMPALPMFGLHTVDVSPAIGDLVDIVGSQAQAYIASRE